MKENEIKNKDDIVENPDNSVNDVNAAGEDEPVYQILTDENGNEYKFELLGYHEYKGNTYYAFIPAEDEDDTNDNEFTEYIILKSVIHEDGTESLDSIEDPDEEEEVGIFMDDLFAEEIDYDGEQ